MAASRPGAEDNASRGPRFRFARRPASPMMIDAPAHHSTLSEIAHRQQEIEAWEAMNVGGYRFAKPGSIIGFLITAVLVFLAVTPVPPNWPWNIPLFILATFTAVGTVVCGLLWFEHPDIGSRPEPLKILPFSRAENLQMMNEQAIEPYRACCPCPGCGDESIHRVRAPREFSPQWATVTRQCGVCAREWAQA